MRPAGCQPTTVQPSHQFSVFPKELGTAGTRQKLSRSFVFPESIKSNSLVIERHPGMGRRYLFCFLRSFSAFLVEFPSHRSSPKPFSTRNRGFFFRSIFFSAIVRCKSFMGSLPDPVRPVQLPPARNRPGIGQGTRGKTHTQSRQKQNTIGRKQVRAVNYPNRPGCRFRAPCAVWLLLNPRK